ncbi:MAG: exosortase F system-associated protein [Flavobacterium sp.]|nr:exosortase F system-associated protein [Flavobacterium sp.]
MLEKIKFNRNKVVAIAILVFCLVSIRALEDWLFYDPFSRYFKNDYLSSAFPKFDALSLFLSMGLRFGLNSVFSLAIIWCLFKDWGLTKFATVLYAFFFVLLISAFFVLVLFSDQNNNFMVFYVRRFLIQPILLLLFIPAIFIKRK